VFYGCVWGNLGALGVGWMDFVGVLPYCVLGLDWGGSYLR
jgi:hypothetical protein